MHMTFIPYHPTPTMPTWCCLDAYLKTMQAYHLRTQHKVALGCLIIHAQWTFLTVTKSLLTDMESSSVTFLIFDELDQESLASDVAQSYGYCRIFMVHMSITFARI